MFRTKYFVKFCFRNREFVLRIIILFFCLNVLYFSLNEEWLKTNMPNRAIAKTMDRAKILVRKDARSEVINYAGGITIQQETFENVPELLTTHSANQIKTTVGSKNAKKENGISSYYGFTRANITLNSVKFNVIRKPSPHHSSKNFILIDFVFQRRCCEENNSTDFQFMTNQCFLLRNFFFQTKYLVLISSKIKNKLHFDNKLTFNISGKV